METEAETVQIDEELAEEMAREGVVFSHKKSKAHPAMRRYISANRHEIDILDGVYALESIDRAAEYISELLKRGGIILFVGTTAPSKESVQEFAESLGQPYVTHRWLGGTITNFKVIRKRVEEYLSMKEKRDKGEFGKYTKKEQVNITSDIERRKQKFSTLEKLTRVPDALFIVDANAHKTAVREAVRKNIPIIAVIDSDDDPRPISYPIIANDHSYKAVKWVIDRIRKLVMSSE